MGLRIIRKSKNIDINIAMEGFRPMITDWVHRRRGDPMEWEKHYLALVSDIHTAALETSLPNISRAKVACAGIRRSEQLLSAHNEGVFDLDRILTII